MTPDSATDAWIADALRERNAELEAAHEKWRKERNGIGFACHGTGLEQERAFAKADSDFTFAVSAILGHGFDLAWDAALDASLATIPMEREAWLDGHQTMEKELEHLRADHEAELAFEEKAHGQTLAERDAARADLKRLQTENERLVGMTGNMRIENADLRAEVERLSERFHCAVVAADGYRAALAEADGSLVSRNSDVGKTLAKLPGIKEEKT